MKLRLMIYKLMIYKLRMRLMIYKWWKGHCRHLCYLCMFRDDCLRDLLIELLEEEM